MRGALRDARRPRLPAGWTEQDSAEGPCSLGLEPPKVHLVGLCCAASLPERRAEGSGKDNRSPQTGLAILVSQPNAASPSLSDTVCLPSPLTSGINVGDTVS